MNFNKKIVLIILGVSAGILILLFLPSNQDITSTNRSELVKVLESDKEINKPKSETYTELTPSDDTIINKIIGNFTKEINYKNFEKAFSMLDKEYIEDFDVELSFFKERYNFKNEKKFNIYNINSDIKDRYIVDIEFQDVEANQNEGIVRKTFTIYKNDNKEYTISEFGVLEEEELNLKNQFRPSMTFELYKIYHTSEGAIAIIRAENKTKSYLAIKNDRFGFYANDGKYTYDHKILNNYSEDYIITPGINKKFIISFNKVKYPSSIGIYYVGTNNENETNEEDKVELFNIN